MTRTLFSFLTALILGLLMTTQSGCLLLLVGGAAAGTGAAVAYTRGDLETTLDADPKQIADAAEQAMKDLDLAVISRSASELDGEVVGRSARDVKLTVTIKGMSDKLSKVYVRAGVFGNDALQSNLMEKIKRHIGTAPAGPNA